MWKMAAEDLRLARNLPKQKRLMSFHRFATGKIGR
jgi:hypothetical protein